VSFNSKSCAIEVTEAKVRSLTYNRWRPPGGRSPAQCGRSPARVAWSRVQSSYGLYWNYSQSTVYCQNSSVHINAWRTHTSTCTLMKKWRPNMIATATSSQPMSVRLPGASHLACMDHHYGRRPVVCRVFTRHVSTFSFQSCLRYFYRKRCHVWGGLTWVRVGRWSHCITPRRACMATDPNYMTGTPGWRAPPSPRLTEVSMGTQSHDWLIDWLIGGLFDWMASLSRALRVVIRLVATGCWHGGSRG